MDIVSFTHQISTLTSSALKRASVAMGYDMTCSAQESTDKSLPDTPSTSEATHESPAISTRKVLEDKTNASDTQQLLPVLEKPCVKSSASIHKQTTARRRPISRGKVSQKDYYKAKSQVETRIRRSEIRKKIRAAKAKKESWNPAYRLEAHWKQLPQKDRDELKSKIESLAVTGSVKAKEWLEWNLPKLAYKAFCLTFNQEMPDSVLDGFRAADMERDLDKLWADMKRIQGGAYY